MCIYNVHLRITTVNVSFQLKESQQNIVHNMTWYSMVTSYCIKTNINKYVISIADKVNACINSLSLHKLRSYRLYWEGNETSISVVQSH